MGDYGLHFPLRNSRTAQNKAIPMSNPIDVPILNQTTSLHGITSLALLPRREGFFCIASGVCDHQCALTLYPFFVGVHAVSRKARPNTVERITTRIEEEAGRMMLWV